MKHEPVSTFVCTTISITPKIYPIVGIDIWNWLWVKAFLWIETRVEYWFSGVSYCLETIQSPWRLLCSGSKHWGFQRGDNSVLDKENIAENFNKQCQYTVVLSPPMLILLVMEMFSLCEVDSGVSRLIIRPHLPKLTSVRMWMYLQSWQCKNV